MKLILAAALAIIGTATPTYAATTTPKVDGATNGSAKVDLTGWSAQSESGTITMRRLSTGTPAKTGVEIKRDGGTGTSAYALSPLKSNFFVTGQTYRMTTWVRDPAGAGRKYGIMLANSAKAHRPTTTTEYVSPTGTAWQKLSRTFTAVAGADTDTAFYFDLPAAGSFKLQVAGVSVQQVTAPTPPTAKNLTPKTIGFANWNYDLGAGGWGNGELQTYAKENATIGADGKLKITVTKSGGAFTSARLNSLGKAEVLGGSYVETSIIAPVGSAVWPAFRLIGANKAKVGSPACGELDVLEGTGSKPTIAQSAVHMSATADKTVDKPWGFTEPGGTTDLGVSIDAAAHKYGVYFDQNVVRFYIDRKPTMTLYASDAYATGRNWPFARRMFMTVSVAISPSYSNTATTFPRTMTVDPISVWRGLPF